jgi:glutamate 5-kinase
MLTRVQLGQSRRWVVKVGSSLITNAGRGLDEAFIAELVAQVVVLQQRGIEVVIVSSGAIAEGMKRLHWKQRPAALYELQAAAAVGQMGMIQAYESHFQRHGMHTAQILLTHDDVVQRQRYLNARTTLRTLLRHHAVPIVNENDTVAVEEIRFGDNDTLAALVANLVEANLLVMLTDQAGMYDRDPRQYPDARLIPEARAGDRSLEQMAGAGQPGAHGRGGMLTKIKAAALAARSGTASIIAAGAGRTALLDIAAGAQVGTLLRPKDEPLAARKQWLAGRLIVAGKLVLDDGAVKVLAGAGRSLLAVGVSGVDGDFDRGELVACVDRDGKEIARGLVNYGAEETRKIMGQPSDRIEALLGYVDEPELIHRDNLVVTGGID